MPVEFLLLDSIFLNGEDYEGRSKFDEFELLELGVKEWTFGVLSIIFASSICMEPRRSRASMRRRALLAGVGLLFTGTSSGAFVFADEVPENYQAFVDFSDGYSYYYPSEWREFDFRGHDSAFKDRTLPLQNVRVSFKPTDKADVRDLGPMEEVITNLVRNVYAAPNQKTQIFDMQERSINGKNYWTFEYEIASSGFSRASFATIAVGNGKCYTLIVGANERRWRKLKDKLRVVADSFKIFDV